MLTLGASTPVGETGPWEEECPQEAALTTLPSPSQGFGQAMFRLKLGFQAGELV